MRFNRKNVNDFATFSNALVRSGDIDPQFWLLKTYYKKHKFSRNTALWHSLVYLAFYHLGSAFQVLENFPEPTIIHKRDWKTGLTFTHQRRLFRGAENYFVLEHLNTLIRQQEYNLQGWMENLVTGYPPQLAWTRVRESFNSLPYAGPWSSYKWCDIVKFVHDYPITAPDIGTKPGATAGPIAGLSSLTGLTWDECANHQTLPTELHDYLINEFGVPFNGLDQLESCLCDWQSVIKGKYYVGHDIDRDQGQIEGSPLRAELHAVRKKLFDHRYLGELQNWPRWIGVRKHLNTAYRSSGRVVNNFPDIKEPYK